MFITHKIYSQKKVPPNTNTTTQQIGLKTTPTKTP